VTVRLMSVGERQRREEIAPLHPESTEPVPRLGFSSSETALCWRSLTHDLTHHRIDRQQRADRRCGKGIPGLLRKDSPTKGTCSERRALSRLRHWRRSAAGLHTPGRELGFTLDEVRTLLELSANDDQATCANVRELAESHLADVREKIADLRAMERVLAEVVRRCAVGEAPGCPIIETLSAG